MAYHRGGVKRWWVAAARALRAHRERTSTHTPAQQFAQLPASNA